MATRRLLADVHPSPTLILGKEMTVLEAAELMTSARTNAGIVQDAKTGALVGILTDSDVSIKVIAGGRGLAATRVGDVMTPRPLCCRTDETATHALGVMASKRARHLPLLDAEGGVSGMLDITKVLYDAIAVLEDRKQKSQNRFWFQAGAPSLKIPSLADALRDRLRRRPARPATRSAPSSRASRGRGDPCSCSAAPASSWASSPSPTAPRSRSKSSAAAAASAQSVRSRRPTP